MNNGDVINWKGKKYYVFNTFEKSMVTLIDEDNNAKAYCMTSVIADLMNDIKKV